MKINIRNTLSLLDKMTIKFYDNLSNGVNKTLVINNLDIEDAPIYLGKDMRLFNTKLLENRLEPIYIKVMKEMQKGFDKILVSSAYEQKIRDICKFLCIEPFVTIVVK